MEVSELLKEMEALLKEENFSSIVDRFNELNHQVEDSLNEFEKTAKKTSIEEMGAVSDNALVATETPPGEEENISSGDDNTASASREEPTSQGDDDIAPAEIVAEPNKEKPSQNGKNNAPGDLSQFQNRHQKLLEKFKQLEHKNQDTIEENFQNNLEAKRGIIEEFKELVRKEKEAGPAFNLFNQLKDRWHNSGHVQSRDEKELQHEYNVLVDEFYYNAKIYRELKEYSLKKNFELKQKLIEKITHLHDVKSIKQVDYLIRLYQKEWSKIGPTIQEKWPEVRNQYYEAVNKVYDRVHKHYDEVKHLHKETYDEKRKIIDEVASINKLEIKKFNDWQKQTEIVIQLQRDWKKTGFLHKKQNDECWKDFKSECDMFFNKKKSFFEGNKETQQKNRDAKKKLIEEADSIKDSKDWKETTESFKEIQIEWKSIGPANRSDEQKLWKKFKVICDHFFDAKRYHFAHLDDARKENLKLKEDLIKEIDAAELSGDKSKDLELIKEFTIKWKSIDQVPSNAIDKINQGFNKAINRIYSSLNIDKHEKDLLKFKHKLDSWKGSENKSELLRKERSFLREKISKAESELYSLQDKMGFFKNTNHANPLRDELVKKIDHQERFVMDLKEKYKLIPNN